MNWDLTHPLGEPFVCRSRSLGRNDLAPTNAPLAPASSHCFGEPTASLPRPNPQAYTLAPVHTYTHPYAHPYTPLHALTHTFLHTHHHTHIYTHTFTHSPTPLQTYPRPTKHLPKSHFLLVGVNSAQHVLFNSPGVRVVVHTCTSFLFH